VLDSRQAQRLRDSGSKPARVLVYCAESGPQHPLDISFPQNIELRVNGEDAKANTRGVKKKPGSTKPADITALIKKNHGSSNTNTLEIVYALTDKSFVVMVMLVTKNSVEHLKSRIENSRVITIDRVLADSKSNISQLSPSLS
jgi:E3 SUMO-protein ligase PIAS1